MEHISGIQCMLFRKGMDWDKDLITKKICNWLELKWWDALLHQIQLAPCWASLALPFEFDAGLSEWTSQEHRVSSFHRCLIAATVLLLFVGSAISSPFWISISEFRMLGYGVWTFVVMLPRLWRVACPFQSWYRRRKPVSRSKTSASAKQANEKRNRSNLKMLELFESLNWVSSHKWLVILRHCTRSTVCPIKTDLQSGIRITSYPKISFMTIFAELTCHNAKLSLLSKVNTEGKIKVCTWLREISSCSCLTVLPGSA